MWTGLFQERTITFALATRQWHPARTGRWRSQDPSGLEPNVNPYRYVGNGPGNWVDPFGLEAYPGGGWNPGNWMRGLYTGDASAPDDVYNAALDAAGQSYAGNSGNAHSVLRTLDHWEPTGATGLTEAVLTGIEGDELAAARANVNPCLAKIEAGSAQASQAVAVFKALKDAKKGVIDTCLGARRDPKTGRFISDPNNPPSPYQFTDSDRRKKWRDLVEDPNSPLTDAQRDEIINRGYRGPQRVNEYGELETLELSHEPIPLRDGGKDVVPRWPADHAAVDPHRQLKQR
ncbi:MAG: RHS repeat-associated core domain-containing protein [Planctomycetaceae bacterium]